MTVSEIPLSRLHIAWHELWPLLQPAVARAPDKPDVVARLLAGEAQLWAVHDEGTAIAAIATMIQERGGRRVCLLWLVGGSRLRIWGADLLREVEAWARAMGCVALWGCGRRGWARIAPKFGGVRIAGHEGQLAWERRLL